MCVSVYEWIYYNLHSPTNSHVRIDTHLTNLYANTPTQTPTQMICPLDMLISLQLRVAAQVYTVYQAPMLARGLGLLYNMHNHMLSSPWFMRIVWWAVVARSWWLLADHQNKFYSGTNALWVYTLPFTVLEALITYVSVAVQHAQTHKL